MSIFVRLLKAYQRHGYLVRTGLNPLYFADPDAPFTHLFERDRTPIDIGGGLAPAELHFLECLVAAGERPARVLVIGNAFGWSALALGMLLPQARIVAIDAGLEGDSTDRGTQLTRTIAAEEALDLLVVNALSPRDVTAVVTAEFSPPALDLVLIDGLHTNDQMTRDFLATLPHASPGCIFVMHDVVHWHMLQGFRALPIGDTRERRILTRCPSGIGVVFPKALSANTRDAIEAFCDPVVDLHAWHERHGATDETPGPLLAGRLSQGWSLRRLGAASTCEREGQPSLALEEIDQAVAENWDDAKALYQIASSQTGRGRWDSPAVVKSLNQAISLRADFGEAIHLLGLVKLTTGEAPAALEPLERALKLQPKRATWLFDLGRAYAAVGRDSEAIVQLSHAVAGRPDWAAAWHLLGVAQARHSGPASALGALQQAARLTNEPAFPLFDLGRVQFALGDLESAEVSLESALTASPDWSQACHLLGLVRQKRGGDADAMPLLARAVATDATNINALQDMGIAAYRLRDYPVAIQCLSSVVAVAPTRAAALHVLGLATARTLGPRASLPWLDRAVAVAPGNGHAWFDLGLSRSLVDDPTAVAAFERSASLLPSWAPPRVHLDRVKKRRQQLAATAPQT